MKYIAVVNPKMEEDELATLIRKGIAGALFSISHQDYHKAARLISLIKELSQKYHKPVSIVQDVSSMQDPLDLQFGIKSGVHWVASDNEKHLKMVKGLNKLAGLIFKGRNLPKGLRVDSVMAENFLDPDAVVENKTHIKHLVTSHKNQELLDSLLQLAHNSDTQGLAVSDLDLAKALAFRRLGRKIILAPKNPEVAHKGALYAGVHPIFDHGDMNSMIRSQAILNAKDRILDARDIKHVEINVV
jgi:pyruvate kinase